MKMITPDINPTFFYGPIVSYRFMGDVKCYNKVVTGVANKI